MREACGIACRAGDMNTFCCDGFKVGDEDVFCADSRLEVDCSVNCEGFECSRGGNFIEIILGVGPNKVNCQTLVPTQCLVVNGQYFYVNVPMPKTAQFSVRMRHIEHPKIHANPTL